MTNETITASQAWTPGPWVAGFGDTPYEEHTECWTVDADSESVCLVDGPVVAREANARLIAAAPDLYEALAGIKWRSADRDNMEFDGRVTTWQLGAIKAALAKARGQ